MNRIALTAALATLVVHLVANPHYGFFRDELYFIICGFHPQFGYVDQPPVIPLLSAGTQMFGHSLFLLRAIPALFAAAGVYVTCLLVIEFGGGVEAMVLAAIAFFFTPVLASFGMKVSPDTVGLLTWPWMALLVVRMVKGADKRLWLAAGALAGVSLQSKYSVIFFLAALLAGMLLTPQRTVMRNRWFAAGTVLAVLIALPNFLWQWHYGFPMLELLRNGQNGKNEIVGPLMYIVQELIITGVLLALVWIAGLVWLFRNAPYRFLAYTYVLLIVMMLATHGKHYYPADVYPILVAAGAVAVESAIRVRAARKAIVAAAFVFGVLLAPLVLPVLPERTFVAYSRALNSVIHFSAATETEAGRDKGTLPGDWADMHGWENMAMTAKRVYESLAPGERSRAVVFAGNYGEASAVAFYAPEVPVISEHNQFWLWGTRGYSGQTLVQINGSCFHSDGLFRSRTLAARVHDRWAIAYEANARVWICRGIRKPLASVWPKMKSYE